MNILLSDLGLVTQRLNYSSFRRDTLPGQYSVFCRLNKPPSLDPHSEFEGSRGWDLRRRSLKILREPQGSRVRRWVTRVNRAVRGVYFIQIARCRGNVSVL